MIAGFRREIRPMFRLAAPLAMAELGWMTMGFVDVIMAGRLGCPRRSTGHSPERSDKVVAMRALPLWRHCAEPSVNEGIWSERT